MEGGSSRKKKGTAQSQDPDFAQLIFSWSLDDIRNENLYENKVEKIPRTFQSEKHYFHSFVHPLLEETRSELASSMERMYRAPFAELSFFRKAKGKDKIMYDVTVGNWRNSETRKEAYRTLPGDLLLLANGEPGSLSDLQSVDSSTWAFLVVNYIDDDSGYDGTRVQFKVTSSQKIEFRDGMFAVFLMNITTQKRIWNSLHKHANLDIIKEILYRDSVIKEKCDMCSLDRNSSIHKFDQNLVSKLNESQKAAIKEKCDMCSLDRNSSIHKFDQNLVSKLNESQKAAIMAAIYKMECCHKSHVEQIWGPPGTGKTMTVSVMLSIFLQMSFRTLACAPTNVAIVAVASRVLSLVKESSTTKTASGNSFCSIGDLLLIGNKERLKVGTNVEEIYLEHRIDRLTECLGSLTGWKHCMKSMIDFLEDCVTQYQVFLENEAFKEKEISNENKNKNKHKTKKLKIKSFLEFVQERFNSFVTPLRRCIVTFCTHVPKSFMKQENFQAMVTLLDNLSSLESLLSQKNLVSKELENIFVAKPMEGDSVKSGHMSLINSIRIMCLSLLKTLQTSLGGLKLPGGNRDTITRFCYERASLIFCTTSTSYKLQKVKIEPLKLLVIDEAAQMKECEAIIPLQIPGMKHAILIGDECQLPATVKSNVSSECGLGRSLFERLSSLGHSKHLLNVQYRMHPKISSFPNCKFYQKQIQDAKNVKCKSYKKQFLSGPMFGSYSFINIIGGREEGDDVGSKRNMVEVSIVIKIVQKLSKEWHRSKKKVSIGVVSPYTAQVVSIEEKLRYKYENCDGFSVTVKSIDGFQGGEEDIIILSTVRSNNRGSVGFMSSPQRTNVALTRARHCLWILGNERTLACSDSVWKDLVCDARNRGCLFDADADECLKKIIIDAKNELEPLNDMVKGNSLLLKHVKWKVLFSDNFRKSFGKLVDSRMKNLVVDLLQKLSGGWRPNDGNVDSKTSSKVLKTYKVEGLHVIWSIDIIKDVKYIQVLKVWDILPLKEIPKLRKELDSIFATYTEDYLNRCTTKHLEGTLEIPKSWEASHKIMQFRKVSKSEGDSEVNESLLHMKFYSLSPGMVNHLRFGREIDLPMQLSDEQMDIFLCSKSSFIIGHLGTGKTTILMLKLLQNERSFHAAFEGFCQTESSQDRGAEIANDHEESKPTVLRQLFVTVSPKSCHVVKQHVSHLTSLSCDENPSVEINLDDVDVTSELNVPDTFNDVPEKSYPLVITFHKFLMMLDGTLGNSFFERFHEARKGSVALQTFIRLRNVTFERFCSLYWPHFDPNLTKKLDPSRVFSEITFHIKGGLQAKESCNEKGYSLLSEGHASTLTKQKRETIDTLFEAYENMKVKRGEFDLGDLVSDLHIRLKTSSYKGEKMDFIYVDEVQDLSMRQISLFKYICQNVEKGFVFGGDTAQTFARGIDFRFEDVKTMFYTEFLASTATGKQEKDRVYDIFQLKQNSKTNSSVLHIAQSVIDILYCYFAHSIGILEPETSLIPGEAPILLKPDKDKNVIVTIIGGTGTSSDIAGFGAEQVILVRDDASKAEICKYVGNQALVLTIAESKGFEFQDVLLYNFFGSSLLKDQWSVIYGYMKEQDWLDEKLLHSFPSFKESKHNILCTELKQLYVAITRTRERLWICENKEELSKPMFDYWKRRGLVQVGKLNDSVAHAMRRASTPQEWLERGKKLFHENIFKMATMCFERAGDSMWETMARAFGLRTSADQIRGKDPEAASCRLREAAEMFESIGKLELAATCYCDFGEYERAGKFYLEKCGQIDAAAECFKLAGCYSDAAEAYAKGDQFSNCLSLCIKGELFDKGLKYISHWKEHFHVRNNELEQIEQEFLEYCALSYYERKDSKSMMKFVRSFCSMDSKRVFLRSLDLDDDLMLLEEESGHFLEAAELAGSCGDVLKEAGFLEKAGRCEEAILLILWYVFFNSLWGNENTGWPLKQFTQKNELCNKAKSLAKKHSNNLHDIVCSEINVLSHKQGCLSKLRKQFHVSQQHKSLRREFILIRKILDAHLQLDILMYEWEDEVPIDTEKYVNDKVSQNHVSVKTLVFYFNLWKDNVMDIFQSLESLDNAEPNKHEDHVDFCLNYFGVRKQCVKGNIVYLLVNKDFDWVKNAGDQRGLHRDGEIFTLDGKQLVHAMRSYWQSELLSVGTKVLETIHMLYSLTIKGSAFHQSAPLLHIFEVSKFLLDCQYLDLTFHQTNCLQDFLERSMTYFDFVFPLDWRMSVSRNLISLRETDLSLNFLEEFILKNLNNEFDFTYWTIGRMMRIYLGSKKSFAVYEKISRGIQWNPLWKSFVEKFWEDSFSDVYVAPLLQNALEDTYRAYWQFPGYMSPHSYVYLLDRLLFMASFSPGFFFTTKSSFVEWYTYTSDATLSASKQIFSKDIAVFLVKMAQHILYEKDETISWIERSKIVASYYHPLIALKLLMIVSLISLQLLDCSQVIIDLLLGSNNVAYLLPLKFVGDLLRRRNGSNLNLNPEMVAEAFASVDDHLLIVNMENATSSVHAPCAIFVDFRRPREEIMSVLFPCKTAHSVQKDKAANNSCDDFTTLHELNISWDALLTPHERNNLCDDLKQPSFASDMSLPEVELSVSTSGKLEETDDEHNNDYHPPSNLVLQKEINNEHTPDVEIKKRRQRSRRKNSKKDHGTLNAFATVVVDGQHCAGEDTTLQEANYTCNDLPQPSLAYDTSRSEVDFVVSRSDDTTTQSFVERGQSSRPIVWSWDGDTTLHEATNLWDDLTTQYEANNSWHDLTTQYETNNSWDDLKQPSFASDVSCTKVEHSVSTSGKETIVQTTAERKRMVGKQTRNDSTQDAEFKKGKGKNKGKCIKNNKASDSVSTFAEGEHSNVHSPVELVLEKQTRNEKTTDVENKKGNGKNMEKWIKKNKSSNSLITVTSDEHSKDHPPVELKLEKKISNDNTEDVKVKKVMGKSIETLIKKNKGSNSLDIFTGDKHCSDLSSVTLVLETQTSSENTKGVEIKKGNGKNMEKWFKKNKGSNTLDTVTSDEHRNDVEYLVEKQPGKEKTKDLEIGKGKGKNIEKLIKKNKGSNSQDISTGKKLSNVHSSVKLVVEKQTSNEVTKDVEIKKGKGKNVDKWIKKSKGSNSVNSSISDAHSNDGHSLVDFVVEKQSSNETTKDVSINKGKGKNKGEFVAKKKGCNNVNKCTGDEHSHGLSQVEFMLEKQTENTRDAEIKKVKGVSKQNKGSNSLNTFTTVLVDAQCSGEEKFLWEANNAFNDVQQPSCASDMSQPKAGYFVSKSGETTTMQTYVERLQSSRPVVDGFRNFVEEIVDDHNIGDHSQLELVLEKQTSNANDNPHDVENKKQKGQYVAGEDTIMCEANSVCNDMKPTSAFDMGIKTLDVVKCGSILGLAAAYLGIRSWRKT